MLHDWVHDVFSHTRQVARQHELLTNTTSNSCYLVFFAGFFAHISFHSDTSTCSQTTYKL